MLSHEITEDSAYFYHTLGAEYFGILISLPKWHLLQNRDCF